MNTHADKKQENKSQSVSNGESQKQNGTESTFRFVDNRPEAAAQRKLQEKANNSPQVSQLRAFQEMTINSPQVKQAVQLQAMADNYTAQQQQSIQIKENNTGLPDNLKTGMENLSGMSLDDVKVHRNSDKPAHLHAHAYAYAQGTDIHLGPGQDKYLPHELGHIVQQKQGRVKLTMQMKGKVNDDAGLEKEADVMGAKASQTKNLLDSDQSSSLSNSKIIPIQQKAANVVQRITDQDIPAIHDALPLEYRAHFQKETTIFGGKERTTRDDTHQEMFKRLKVKAMTIERKTNPKPTKGSVLASWSIEDAAKVLCNDADIVVARSKEDRQRERGDKAIKPFMNGGQIVKFTAPDIGSGELEILQGSSAVLLFAAHGFTHSAGISHVFNNETKDFGFMSGPRESVERASSTKDKYEAMAKELRVTEDRYKVTGVPDLVVYPHYPGDAIKDEGPFLKNLKKEMDVAILREWVWNTETELGQKLATAFVNTVPLTFILGTPPLNAYSKYLMQVCRADWSREVPVSGGSKRVSASLNVW